MTLIITDSFTDSLAKLTGQEQAAAKQTAFDLQVNPDTPGLSMHRVDRAKDKDFWTARVNRDLRIVLHKRDGNTVLAYVGRHDDAYAWAERRRFEVHPRTGAAQIVEIRERVENVVIRRYIEEEVPKPALLAGETDDTLLDCGVPEDWLDEVRKATEDTLLDVAEHLPAEAGEAVLNLAFGIRPEPPAPAPDPFAHPDAQRRFRLMVDEEELARALDAPWEKWTVFLHPSQRDYVTRDFNGPARIIGSAGTGKTVVALHRAVRLARENPDARVLLTTFNATLAKALRAKLALLAGGDGDLATRIEVGDLGTIGFDLYNAHIGPEREARDADVRHALAQASSAAGDPMDMDFLLDEWRLVVDAKGLTQREDYLDVARHGRRVRVAAERRAALWDIFEAARSTLSQQRLITRDQAFYALARWVEKEGRCPFGFVIVDEAQDIAMSELFFLAALAADKPNGLFFAGDIGQRIFRSPFSWKSCGVEIRGRSRSLKVNYRTSHQIRLKSDRLLPPTITEVDGGEDDRRSVISVFEGPNPTIQCCQSSEDEIGTVSDWLRQVADQGIAPSEIGVIVRSSAQLTRAKKAIGASGLGVRRFGAEGEDGVPQIGLATMHQAKGLEFRAVVVMACDDGIVPLEDRVLSAVDAIDLEGIYATERHLLYVACTRAREQLFVSGVEPVSEFLEDLLHA